MGRHIPNMKWLADARGSERATKSFNRATVQV